jgi:hypothetical protein
VFVLTIQVISASSDLTDIHSGEQVPFSKCNKVFCLIWHFCDALCLPCTTSYGMYVDFWEGSKDPNALVRASPSTIEACERWLEILRTQVYGSFAPENHSGSTSYVSPVEVSVYIGASKEGLCGFCHGYYFKVDLMPRWTALPMAVLNFVAFYRGILTFVAMVMSFKVSLLTDSTFVNRSPTRALRGRSSCRWSTRVC